MKLYVKYMVSLRCRLTMKEDLKKMSIQSLSMDSGVVEITPDLNGAQRDLLYKSLLRAGMELLDEEESRLIESLEQVIYDMIYLADEAPERDEATYLSQKLNQEFASVTHLFAEVRGASVEQYIIVQKIERAKELLLYENMTIGEVAQQLRFQSTPHLSSQFKKITGLTPLFFRQLRRIRMKIQHERTKPALSTKTRK